MPYAFTEHGITMRASILNSPGAINMNTAIVNAFISLQQFALEHTDFVLQLEKLRNEFYARTGEHDTQLAAIYDAIENLLDYKAQKKNREERERIGFSSHR